MCLKWSYVRFEYKSNTTIIWGENSISRNAGQNYIYFIETFETLRFIKSLEA